MKAQEQKHLAALRFVLNNLVNVMDRRVSSTYRIDGLRRTGLYPCRFEYSNNSQMGKSFQLVPEFMQCEATACRKWSRTTVDLFNFLGKLAHCNYFVVLP